MESFRLLHLADLHIAVQQKVIGFPDRKHLWQYPLGQLNLSPSSYFRHFIKANPVPNRRVSPVSK